MEFSLQVITPVHIGSGDVLFQFSDYIYHQGYVYYLNREALFRDLSNGPGGDRLVDSYVNIVFAQAGSNVRNRFNLKNFLEEAGIDFCKYALRRIPVTEEIKEQLHLQVRCGGQPYIPGSSIKGAIRTALIGYKFTRNDEESVMKNFWKKDYIGQNYFGYYGDDVLKNLLVSDTAPFKQDNLVIAKFTKYHVVKGKEEIPLIKEVVSAGSNTVFSIKTKARPGDVPADLQCLCEDHEAELLPIINEYSRQNIKIELELLRRGAANTTELVEFYTDLLQEIDQADPTAEAYMRIGFGKTYYDNTIAQKLSPNTLRRIVSKHFPRNNPQFFPKTCTVISYQGRKAVPGWIKISRR